MIKLNEILIKIF